MTAKQKREEPLRPFKNINFTRITVRALLIFFFIGISFTFSYWRDEGTLGSGPIRNFIADMFSYVHYPSLDFLYKSGYYTWTTYVLGLLANAFIYSIIIGIILKLISKFRKPKEPKEISIR
jgi:hypothetical protein